jgi:uncharacterized protein YbjT (DUF2867 family)
MTANTHSLAHQLTLVLGGNGKTGRRIVERLTTLGVPVRVGSRSGNPPFDWNDPDTWADVVDGVSAAYIAYTPDLIVPGAVEAVRAFSEVAVKSGVTRLVLLSGRGEEEAMAAEEVVQQSGAEWTIVRCSWFNQNFSEDYLLEPVLEGAIALPGGLSAEPFVDAEDIADVATAALTDGRHSGQVYELTGPRLLTFADAAGEISRATGREIEYVPVSTEEYVDGAKADGLPAEIVDVLANLFTRVLDGRNASLADGVQRALGRPPRDFADFAADVARTGAWNAQ